MPIYIGGQEYDVYVGNQQCDLYVGNQLITQSIPDYNYPPIVMNMGYTNLEYKMQGTNKTILEEGVGFYFLDKTYQYGAINFTLPTKIGACVITVETNKGTFVYDHSFSSITYQYFQLQCYKVDGTPGLAFGVTTSRVAGGNLNFYQEFDVTNITDIIVTKITINPK